jgi:hypothetical protein
MRDARSTAALLLLVAVAACEADHVPVGTPPGDVQVADIVAAKVWYTTCGDPVCSGYAPPVGVPKCDLTMKPGEPCDVVGARCDPQDPCNALLECATEDPKAKPGGCPL